MQGIWRTIQEMVARRIEPQAAGRYVEDLRNLPEHTRQDIGLKESDIVALEVQDRTRRAVQPLSWG